MVDPGVVQTNLLRISTSSRNAREALAEGSNDLARAYIEVVIAAADELDAIEREILSALARAE